MTKPDDAAYATPTVTGLPNSDFEYGQRGLTKRELFAAMAMQGMIANPQDGREPPADVIAGWAVVQADALIEALNKEQP